MLSINQTAQRLGVSQATLRRWDRAGKLVPHHTIGGHRRYSYDQIAAFGWVAPDETEYLTHPQKIAKRTYVYGRVSSYKQRQDGNLKRQVERLQTYHRLHYPHEPPCVILKEYGSGLNCHRKALWRLLRAVKYHKVRRILIAYKDRLTRFGFDYLAEYCDLFHVPIIEVAIPEDPPLETQLVTDLMSLIASFSGKLYKLRALKEGRRAPPLTSAQVEAILINKKVHFYSRQAFNTVTRTVMKTLPLCA
jgi:excisionase family DNA binding protein